MCSEKGLIHLIDSARLQFGSNEKAFKTIRIVDLEKPTLKNTGLARLGQLKEATTIRQVIETFKTATKLKYVRLALANGKTIGNYLFLSLSLSQTVNFKNVFKTIKSNQLSLVLVLVANC